MNNVVVDASHLAKSYVMGKVEVAALKDATFTISKGEFVSIIGASGSGKSTLLNLLGLIDTPSKGDLVINNHQIKGLSDVELTDLRAKEIGFIYQNFNLIPVLTILDNVMLQLKFSGVNAKKRRKIAIDSLKKVNLEHRIEHYPKDLSGGERQRACIARAIAKKPSIILADEPTGSLDSKNGLEVMKIINQIKEEGTTIIMVTHDLQLAEQADRKLVMNDGTLTAIR